MKIFMLLPLVAGIIGGIIGGREYKRRQVKTVKTDKTDKTDIQS